MADLHRKQRERLAKGLEFTKYIQAIELGQVPLLEVIHQQGLIDERPVVEFSGRCFLFTGKLAMGARATAQSAVVSRGGLLAKSKSVSNAVDYLVLGAENWRELEHGVKLTSAVVLRLGALEQLSRT